MTDIVSPAAGAAAVNKATRRDIGIKRRYAAERRFRAYGLAAISFGLIFLFLLLWSVVSKGHTAFQQTMITVPVEFSELIIDPKNERATNPAKLMTANYPVLARDAVAKVLGVAPTDKAGLRAVNVMISDSVRTQLRDIVVADPSVIGTTRSVTLLASGDVDSAFKGQVDMSGDEANRRISNQQLGWMNQLVESGQLGKHFNTGIFVNGASSRPEAAGVGVALIGSFYMMLIVLVLSLPIGVAASIYLEEFAPKNRLTDLIEVNINNLAAVPSIVYGLLGLSVFINFMGFPRSASLVGGLVLTLMTLPTIIIATRAALKAVPPSIRAAALGLGASKMQTIFHHVLPLAMPGILTGTIIGLAHALGETAPLLLIGMVAFVANYPTTPMDPSTALPVQIYMWANEAERAFVERTSGAIIILLLFLILMNVGAILLRRRFERRW
ncbi:MULTISPECIES: phosphate ABC transporter permease PstA [Rhizobium/Agrobacterium group]|jgi:phosphate transport system permease protein|uniref:Phosphate transport system permease protein PstA n=2 Tax=Rhizobium/Agrobacterium group TaxID=227290 RepID=A0AA86FTQ5_AGRTU|nr:MULTISPECIES: phosphate ABC transporter permease PstA [Rhizobium/Agrobacterium group]AHK00321.1 phosphate transport system permease protein PstA [Agrobacterium tumefaciens LBA4213 (Ach5)]AKC06175.1 phosphate transport system permease protein [Agrobacterium tumefaciens]EHJ98256.1 phosphate ABC transporter, permease protein PstA [Agrobacterium tumefaciens 5A]MDP9559824.1 phosphate transport system permease protein [Rhizobium nepotum]QDG92166.1 phosphate ABC transporter permease PstA [Rhizobiu